MVKRREARLDFGLYTPSPQGVNCVNGPRQLLTVRCVHLVYMVNMVKIELVYGGVRIFYLPPPPPPSSVNGVNYENGENDIIRGV